MTDFLASLVPLLGRTLLDFLWQGAVIGLLAAVALQALRNARPQARYAVACIALLACLLVPAIELLVLLCADGGVPTALATSFAATLSPPLAPLGDVSHSPPATLDPAHWALRLQDAWPTIVAAWAAGTGALSLRMALGVAWIARLRSAPQGPQQRPWQARLDVLAAGFALSRPVGLRLVDGLDSPAAAGWWRPVVLLPAALLTHLPVELVEALLAHELAHVRRHDYLVNLLQTLVEALLFYHPVTWWLSRRIRAERELVADQLAARVVPPRRLARALAALAELPSRDVAFPALAPAAHGGPLMSRIEKLIRPDRRHAGARTTLPLLVLAGACIAVVAQARTGPEPATPAVQTASAVASAPATRSAVAASTAPAAPATAPAARRNEGEVRRIVLEESREPTFAIVQKSRSGITMSGSVDEADEIERTRDRLGQDFLWFRRDGKAYVVTDPGTVRRAADAWRETEANGRAMEQLGAQMQVHGRKMEAIGAQMQAVSARKQTSTPEIEAASQRIQQMSGEMQALAGQQAQLAAAMTHADVAEHERLEVQMAALDQKQDALSDRMDTESARIEAASERLGLDLKPLDDLGRQMDEAGKPMEALGKQMDVLGHKQDQLSAQAERETRQLIEEAVAKGLASPAPTH